MKTKDVLFLVGFLVLIGHAMIIAEDVNAVLNDPSEQNKPGEVLKLAFDIKRYLG